MSNDRAKVRKTLGFYLNRVGRMVLACILVAVAIWPVGTQPQATQAAPAYVPQTPTPPESPITMIPIPSTGYQQQQHFPDLETAFDAALSAYVRQIAPYQVFEIGDIHIHQGWAYAVAYGVDTNGQRVPYIFIVLLARQDPAMGWRAIAPEISTVQEYNTWLDAFPASLLDENTKAYLRRPESGVQPLSLLNFGGHRLPWPVGQFGVLTKKDNCACYWGCGGTGHENQVDFAIPGDVFASKPGTVVFVKGSSNSGCCRFSCWQQANMVVIQHGSSEYSWYVHLAHNSVPVSVGDTVGFGTKIGVEGNTGYSCGAHLHYMASTGHTSWTNPGDPNAAPWGTGITAVDFAEVAWSDLALCQGYTSQNSGGGSSGPKVKLYSEANRGGSTVFSGGAGFSNDPNADSYSMEIPSGWSVKTWRGDDRTGGEPRCWWESVPNLQDHGWHLAIQSIEVYDYNACPQVELFSHANYDNRIFNGGPGFHDNLGANSYSMRMPSGWSVKTWRGDDRTGGEPRCWWESIPNLQDHGWHLAIRSMEIHDHYVCDPIRLNFATGLGHQADVEIVVTRVGNDQDRLFQNIVTTDSQGNYSGELLLPEHIKPGKYDIYAKPSAYLRRNVSNFQLNPGTNTVNFSSPFLAGDIDKNGQDNRINVMDLLRVLQEWGSSQSIADLNRDGIVGIGDMLLILQNWGPGDGWHDDGPFIGASGATAIGAQDAIVAQDATGTVTLAPDAGTFNVGDTFGVQVLLDTGGHDADGVDLVILYDPGVLEVQDADPTEPGVQVSAGSIYSNIQENMADPSLGEIRFSADGATFQGSGTLATITFTVVASINNTAVKVYYGNGWTAETNIVESESIVDVLAQANAASFQTIGSPSRSMPTVSFTPSTDAVLNSSLIELEVEATDPYTQVKEVKFEVDLSGEWTTIGADTYSPNGWGLVWDASSVSDGSYEVRATAFLLGGEGTTVTNTNIMLDRVPPMYALSAFTPSSAPSTGVPVTIEVIAADEGSGVDYIDVYANSANDGSTNGVWNFLGSISGSQGSLIWDTSGYSIGVHQIAFDIRDMAGNQGPDPQSQLFFTIEGGNKTYLPIILKQ